MENLSLYRKYRPQKFSEVIGQESVIKVLNESIKSGNIVHAYIFAGSRGTGKTSVARIFSKEIGVSPIDLYEIDAASNTGVDDIRALNESVFVLPFESDYKVYLLDEAHMLSKSAFNALLKTIEEPPAHVIFILATTETDKLPETIISRCQVLKFNKPNKSNLIKAISNVSKGEGVKIDSGAMDIIATLGDGSFRDTLGVLQKVITVSGSNKKNAEKITGDMVSEITGAPKTELVNEALNALNNKDNERGIETVMRIREEDIQPQIFLELLLDKVRTILIIRSNPKAFLNGAPYSDDDMMVLDKIAKSKESNINSKTLISLLDSYSLMRSAPDPLIALELLFIQ